MQDQNGKSQTPQVLFRPPQTARSQGVLRMFRTDNTGKKVEIGKPQYSVPISRERWQEGTPLRPNLTMTKEKLPAKANSPQRQLAKRKAFIGISPAPDH